MTQYETVVGLEIHAELATKTKLFCSCPNDPFRAIEPNIYICPVCLALPGSLPVMNRKAVEWSALVGLAVGAQVGWPTTVSSEQQTVNSGIDAKSYKLEANTSFTKWDRKNYFYPDLPKGYQISQYDLPIDHGGGIIIDGKAIEITRIHLEEDTGKLIHSSDGQSSFIDYNRAGVPLLELVTEPVIRSAKEASAFAQMYQLVLRTLGAANGDMEKGEMRVEANISVRPIGETAFGTKVEVKNLNSFKSVERAIAYETERQIKALETGEPLRQETRGWDENKGQTFIQRVKETAADYRYFPDPDLPPVTFDSQAGVDVSKLRESLPVMPWERKEKYLGAGIPEHDADRLMWSPKLAEAVDRYLTEPKEAALMANWVVNGFEYHSIHDFDFGDLDYLLRVVVGGEIKPSLAKHIREVWQATGKNPRAIIEEEGLLNLADGNALATAVEQVLQDNTMAVGDYRSGKTQALGALIGKTMAHLQGKADPKEVKDALILALSKEA